MGKFVFIFLFGLLLSGCSTFSKYSESDKTNEGIKVRLGSKDNINVGDRLRVLKCTSTYRGCGPSEISSLIITRVSGEHESLGVLEKDAPLEGRIFFERM